MAVLTAPSRVEHFVQGQHDIVKLKSGLSTHPSVVSPPKPMKGLHDTSPLSSGNSTPSQRSSLVHCPPKEQLAHCLEQYQALVQEGLDSNTAKEAAFWCCLGLGAVTCSQLSLNQQTPLSTQSRTGSTHSLDSVSDSGFAPSFDSPGRHYLSLEDPDVGNSVTNLVGGLAGIIASGLLNTTNAPHGLSPPDISHDLLPILSRFGFAQTEKIENILALVTKIARQLLSILQGDCGATGSMLSYWVLCLKFIISSSGEDTFVLDELRSQLLNLNPPYCLAEPARSYLHTMPSRGGALGLTPFPTCEPALKSPHVAARFHHRTRSRAASLMSHTSLRSFSSVRSLGSLSAKSSATMSLSHDFGVDDSTSPSGSFTLGSSMSALGSLDSVAENFQVQPRQRGQSITTPRSPLKRSTLSRSMSDDDSSSGKGKGKENVAKLPREGVRPGPANLSVRTGTRFVVTSPPTPSGLGRSSLPLPKLDPVLAALEKSSKLKSKSVCLNCGKKGDNYPCCPRCSESWCSRECRIAANNGGKHVCKRSNTLA